MVVYVNTIAYNAEKTIGRCLESIVSQTYKGEIIWEILDNGSTDETFKIIRKYSSDYPFIHPFHIDQNHDPITDEENKIYDYFYFDKLKDSNNNDDDFYCALDSDDAYTPDFIEKSVAFIAENNLDIVCVGSRFIDAQSGEEKGSREINQNVIYEKSKDFGRNFATYFPFMRTVWGKLYRMGFLKKCDFSDTRGMLYGGDTVFAAEAFKHAARVGIMSGTLHDYYISPKSASYIFEPKRILSDGFLYEKMRDFLISKVGSVSAVNYDILLSVFFNGVCDTLAVLEGSDLSQEEKINLMTEILDQKYMKNVIKVKDLGGLCGQREHVTECKKLMKDIIDSLIYAD